MQKTIQKWTLYNIVYNFKLLCTEHKNIEWIKHAKINLTPMEIDIHRNTSQLCLRYDIASL